MNLRPKIREAKDPVPVVVGQRWRDLYGPLAGRVMAIVAIVDGHAVLTSGDYITHGTGTRLSLQNLRKNWTLEE